MLTNELDLAKFWEKQGRPFQGLMIAAFMLSSILSYKVDNAWAFLATLPAFFVFGWCLAILYFAKKRLTGLITYGPFKYTRNPMYLSMFIMNLSFWIPNHNASPLFYLMQFVFVVCLLIAGWHQEKETLARFGQEATDYYKVTPRIPFTPF